MLSGKSWGSKNVWGVKPVGLKWGILCLRMPKSASDEVYYKRSVTIFTTIFRSALSENA